jgi:hypothetical protein
MRVLISLLLLLAAATLPAQVPDTAQADRTLSEELAREIAAQYNAPAALRATGAITIGRDQVVDGNVAVLHGPLTILGRVNGNVVVINGNLLLQQGAVVTGAVSVAGGAISGVDGADIGGGIRWNPQSLRFRLEGDRLVPERERRDLTEFIDWRVGPGSDDQWRSRITIMSGGTYNRVEGLPILTGPSLRYRSEYMQLALDVLGILRSAGGFRWDRDDLGYDVQARVRVGETQGLSLRARLFDVVQPVEEWQLRASEVGFASFLVRRDYRDYFNVHGASATLGAHASDGARLELEYSTERTRSREEGNPFSLFRRGAEWRVNPEADAGRYRILTGRLILDTRNEPVHPRTGWLFSADIERGSSDAAFLAAGHDVASEWSGLPADRVVSTSYTRAFLDLRRYNRVSPGGQLNLRAVLGGWIGGDDLPVHRRLSVGGAGSLPGYNFRRSLGDDVFTCGGVALPGAPGLCERVALAQIEFRGDLQLHWGRERRNWWIGVDRPASWVLFANSGRGWLVEGGADDGIRYDAGRLPPLRTFRSDIGGGLDFGWIGFFVAKSVSDPGEPANFFMRLRHRF